MTDTDRDVRTQCLPKEWLPDGMMLTWCGETVFVAGSMLLNEDEPVNAQTCEKCDAAQRA